MKTTAPKSEFPKVLKEGHAQVTIYKQANPTRRFNPETGKREPTGKVFDEYVLAYYHGSEAVVDKKTCPPVLDEATGQPKQDANGKLVLDLAKGTRKQVPKFVRLKFGDFADAEREARFTLVKLANAEGDVLKLTGLDRAAYVSATQQLREWAKEASLNLAVADYVAAARRLPDGVTLQQAVAEFLRRHPSGLPKKTVREVLDELLAAKTGAGRSRAYLLDLSKRLARFADAFGVPIATVTGAEINDWIAGLKLSGRSQINFRRVIATLFKFAKARKYLPKDWDEMGAVERPADDSGEIEVFSVAELRKLFAACFQTVTECGAQRTREGMVPYLAIAAFAGLRPQEIKRLDWAEVHLTGAERFIEIKAAKAKTKSRRTVPVTDNLAAWLAPYAQAEGAIVEFARADKQLFERLAPLAGVEWKRNALRHSYISYRVAVTKNVHQVSLEAGNSAQMIFKHYRQLVTETAAAEWFAVLPPQREGAEIIPLPAAENTADSVEDRVAAGA